MFWMTLAALALIFAYLALVLRANSRTPKFGKRLPGPLNLPFLGCALQIGALSRRHKNFEVFEEFCKEYGPIVGLQAGLQHIVLIEDYQTAKTVLTSGVWAQRMPDHDMYRLVTFKKNLGLMFAVGRPWRTNRRFVFRHLKDFGFGTKSKMEVNFSEEVQYLLERVNRIRSAHHDEVLVHRLFKMSSLNMLWRTLTGTRFSEDDPGVMGLISRVERTIANVSIGSQPKYAFPFLRHVPWLTDTEDQAEGIGILQDMFRQILEARRKTGGYESNENDFIDLYLKKIDDSRGIPDTAFTDEQLITTCCDLFMAGADTTGNSIEFSILYMLKFPEVQAKVHSELDSVIPPGQVPTLRDCERLPYTEAVILETLRYCPIVPLMPRSCTVDTLIDGYFVPKNSLVMINNFRMNHDVRVWGDPALFRPERFLDASGSVVNSKKLLAFGAGSRACVGMTSARMSLFTFFTRILHRYRIEPSPNQPHVSLNAVISGINNQPEPFRALLKERIGV